MDVLYIPQLDGDDGSGEPLGGRYRMLRRIPEDGVVALVDRAITRIEAPTSAPLTLVVPPLVKGAARDFFVRLVAGGEEPPQITFAAPPGETASFESVDESDLTCGIGANHYAFTETEQGVFLVNRNLVEVNAKIALDPCGGTCGVGSVTVKLGAYFVDLPVPYKDGMAFEGWFTAAEGGTEVKSGDRCRTASGTLYAHWKVYVDPFADYICPAKNLTFRSEGGNPWTVDRNTYRTAPGAARSGPIGDGGSTSLTTVVNGGGVMTFWTRTSTEQSYDKLAFLVDGVQQASVSGDSSWREWSMGVTGSGPHTVEWRYTKDASQKAGSDCCWVDEVVWTPEG